jgi:serine/threonine-protein kinase
MPNSSGNRAAPPPPSSEDPDDDVPYASVRRSMTTLPEGRRPEGVVEGRVAALPPGKFAERELIGRGGSGLVIRAFDTNLLRDVAVKVLSPDIADGDREAERFVEEARITGQLEHPNVVPVYEFGLQESGRRYLCMKVVEGENLEDALGRLGEGRLEPDALADLLQIFVKVCEAVSFAHSRGVIHRDLKPRNIMISDFGQVYVVDWGIALLQGEDGAGPRVRLGPGEPERRAKDPPGALVGTPCYMAPEQLQGREEALDPRTDVFALGGTLYQMLTGQPPLTPEAMRAIWMRREPPPIEPPEGPRVPPELARIAMRAMAYDPKDRYESVGQLKRDVESFQRGGWRLPRVAFSAGTVIIEEGAPGETAYVVQEGQCVAYRVEGAAEVVLRVMGPGEVFGETAVFSAKPRTASVKAQTDVVLLVVTREVLSQAVGLNSWMGAFVKALADRFREVDEKLRVLERGAAEKVTRSSSTD